MLEQEYWINTDVMCIVTAISHHHLYLYFVFFLFKISHFIQHDLPTWRKCSCLIYWGQLYITMNIYTTCMISHIWHPVSLSCYYEMFSWMECHIRCDNKGLQLCWRLVGFERWFNMTDHQLYHVDLLLIQHSHSNIHNQIITINTL